ncbi:MAG: hypothetical protein JO288_12620 [Hyphomicrobiales bacterium]|nr:hypothetical protein [Hyphomicrobiales bacterium]
MSRGRMLVGSPAVFVRRIGVLLRLFMLAEIVVVGRLMMMMRGGVMVSGGVVMMLARRMLGRFCHVPYSSLESAQR